MFRLGKTVGDYLWDCLRNFISSSRLEIKSYP